MTWAKVRDERKSRRDVVWKVSIVNQSRGIHNNNNNTERLQWGWWSTTSGCELLVQVITSKRYDMSRKWKIAVAWAAIRKHRGTKGVPEVGNDQGEEGTFSRACSLVVPAEETLGWVILSTGGVRQVR